MVSQEFLALHCEAQRPITFCASTRDRRIAHSLVADVSMGLCRVVRIRQDAERSADILEEARCALIWHALGQVAAATEAGVDTALLCIARYAAPLRLLQWGSR